MGEVAWVRGCGGIRDPEALVEGGNCKLDEFQQSTWLTDHSLPFLNH